MEKKAIKNLVEGDKTPWYTVVTTPAVVNKALVMEVQYRDGLRETRELVDSERIVEVED
jgi:hypothetical protein